MSAPHRADFERPRGLAPGVPHVGAVLAFAAAVFVATLLALLSAGSRAELGGWWMAAMAFAVACWLAAVLAASLGWKLADALGAYRTGLHGGAAMFALVVTICGMVAIAGLAFKLPPVGSAVVALPFALSIAFFWARRKGVDAATGIVAGVLLFIICVRLFTMAGRPPRDISGFPGAAADDIAVLSWNVGSGAPGFAAAGDNDLAGVAETIERHAPHIVCLQEVPSSEWVDQLRVELGAGWRGIASPGEGKATAVLSRIGGNFEAPGAGMRYGGPSIVRIASDRGKLNFVSCHAAAGRDSDARRSVVEWVLTNVRSPDSKTVVAGDFNIDPEGGWSFLRPVLTDAPRFDLASWRALKVLGSDPGAGGSATTSLGRRTDWVVVDAKMPVTEYKVLNSARGSGMDHAPVLVHVSVGQGGREVAGKP